MPITKIHECECEDCQHEEVEHPNRALHQQINVLVSRLDEQQRRWFVALESNRIGHGGDVVISKITGLDEKTIRRGRREMQAGLADQPTRRIRLPGGGRPLTEKRSGHRRGSPGIGRGTDRRRSDESEQVGAGQPSTVEPGAWPSRARRVGSDGGTPTQKAWLRASSQPKERGDGIGSSGSGHAVRLHRRTQKATFIAAGEPVISVDTKKKELIGNFKNAGQAWGAQAEQVNMHDFPSEADGRAVPYGIYDVVKNRGWVVVGRTADTPEFAVEAIVSWWEEEGRQSYLGAKGLLILADGGGSNGARSRVFKQQVQERLADRSGVEVTVCHYPRGCSKYNPVEHRLFSFITLNWAGKPLRSFEAMLGFIRTTTTKAGLKVKAVLNEKVYAKGKRVSDAEMKTLNLERHEVCPDWNYTIRPRLVNA